MYKKKWHFVALILLVALLSSTVSYLNTRPEYELNEGVLIFDGHIYIPIRNITDALGIRNLMWRTSEKAASFNYNGKRYVITSDSNLVVIDGESHAFDSKLQGRVHGGRLMLPISFVEQIFDIDLIFNRSALSESYSSLYHTHIPILMYHELMEMPVQEGVNLEGLFVHPDTFERQLDALLAKGYQTVTMQAVYEHWTFGAPLPEKPVVLTFDDGYRTHYSVAYKALFERGMVGTFYVYSDGSGRYNGVTEAMVLEMHENGMEIAGHTASHVNLTHDGVDFERELGASKAVLERIINAEIKHFSYPYGGHNKKIMDMMAGYGYLTSTNVRAGFATPKQSLFSLHRITIKYGDEPEAFIKKIVR